MRLIFIHYFQFICDSLDVRAVGLRSTKFSIVWHMPAIVAIVEVQLA